MQTFIHFCNKTAGSNWWLIATIASIALPSCAILYTFHQFMGIHPELIRRIFIGCDYSLIKFLWIDTGLRCGSPSFGNLPAKGASIILDILLMYIMTFSTTFFRIWNNQVFLDDFENQFSKLNILKNVKVNTIKKPAYFFSYFPFGKKYYWQKFFNGRHYPDQLETLEYILYLKLIGRGNSPLNSMIFNDCSKKSLPPLTRNWEE